MASEGVPDDHQALDEHRKRRGPFDSQYRPVADLARAGDVFGVVESAFDGTAYRSMISTTGAAQSVASARAGLPGSRTSSTRTG
jgi:hypothetical protein